MKFTRFQIDALRPKAERYIVWEDGGLGVRVTPKGRKTWITMYRHKGKSRMMSHGRFPGISLAKARTLHTTALEAVDHGEDPAADLKAHRSKERDAPTFGDLADEYINHRETRQRRSWREQKRVIDSELLPAWKTWKLKEIERRHVVALLDAIVDRGAPVMANRTKSQILTMFKFAVDRGLLDDLPFYYLKKPGGNESERQRVLSDDEIKTFWNKLDEIKAKPAIKKAFRVLLLTGARRGELVKAKKSDIDLQKAEWRIPAENSKNGNGYTVPLSAPVLELMGELLKLADESDYLLPSPIGDKPITERSLTRALSRAQSVIGLAEPFVVHDLRRTVVSGLGRVRDRRGNLISDVVKDHVINHLRPKMERTYDKHDYSAEKREALEMWASHVQSIVTDRKVVPLHGREAPDGVVA